VEGGAGGRGGLFLFFLEEEGKEGRYRKEDTGRYRKIQEDKGRKEGR
jgi:hypothetical protein